MFRASNKLEMSKQHCKDFYKLLGHTNTNLYKYDFKETDRLCKVAELSMQCFEKHISDSFETNFLKI